MNSYYLKKRGFQSHKYISIYYLLLDFFLSGRPSITPIEHSVVSSSQNA